MPKTRSTSTAAKIPAASRRPSFGEAVDRWALLVGVSKYAQEDLSLKYAARDAKRLREVLLQPTAGAFAEDHVLMLVDDEADLAGLNRALRTFLKRPATNDLVVLFFACHGSFDPERPGNLYLLPHDADLQDISGTGLPMREIDLALRETLHSQRVVVLMDACHSGGVGGRAGGLRAAKAEANDLNQYLNALSVSRGGVSLMTSAMANESSLEGSEWGRGHGVFTHFLLEGLKGKADREPRDGVITVGKLFDYVTEQVKQATGGHQHPHIGATADRDLPLAVMAASSAEQHVELACALRDAALFTNEPLCWLGAAQQYEQAMRLSAQDDESSVVFDAASAWAQCGALGRAWKLLDSLPRDAPDVRARLGMVELALGRVDQARSTLLHPNVAAQWAPALLEQANKPQRRVALLVALDRVDPDHYGGWEGPLKSPVSETRAFGEFLEKEMGFDEVVWLLDRHATGDALRKALAELMRRSDSFAAFVLMLSGHGGEMVDPQAPKVKDGTFVAFDEQVTSTEIDALLRHSRATRTTVIASVSHSGYFAAHAAASGYEAMVSCGIGQTDMEGERFGVFAEALFEHLRPNGSPRALASQVAQAFKKDANSRQVPEFVLHPTEPPIAGIRTPVTSVAGQDIASALLGEGAVASDEVLASAIAFAMANDVPSAWCAGVIANAAQRSTFGRLLGAQSLAALARRGEASACAAVLQAAQREVTPAALGRALEALAVAAARLKRAPLRRALREASQAVVLEGRVAERTHAVLVGLHIEGVSSGGRRNAADNVAAVEAVLLAAGVPAVNIVRLLDEQASTRAVRAALQRASQRQKEGPLLIYWCGPGFGDSLVCHGAGELSLAALAKAAGGPSTLLVDGCDLTVPASGPGDATASMLSLGRRRDASGEVAALPWRPRLDGRSGKARYAPVALTFVEALRASELGALLTFDLVKDGRCAVIVARAGGHLLADPISDHVAELIAQLRSACLEHAASRTEQFLELRGGGDGWTAVAARRSARLAPPRRGSHHRT